MKDSNLRRAGARPRLSKPAHCRSVNPPSWLVTHRNRSRIRTGVHCVADSRLATPPSCRSLTGTRTRFWRLKTSRHTHRPSSRGFEGSEFGPIVGLGSTRRRRGSLEPAAFWLTTSCSVHWSYCAEIPRRGAERGLLPSTGGEELLYRHCSPEPRIVPPDRIPE